MDRWIGVDYGSKLAGTTAIYYMQDNTLHCVQSKKKQDADIWLSNFINSEGITQVYLDAPLSLPGAFRGINDHYFYRKCDKLTKAMSPMFLGGLTARAIKLKDSLPDVKFVETYPAYLIKQILDWQDIYTKKEKINDRIIMKFQNLIPYEIKTKPMNWHQLDALACWYTGYRSVNEGVVTIGDSKEGLIII